MKTGRTKKNPIIGLPMSSLYDPYQMTTWKGIYTQAQQMDVRLLCFGSGIFDLPDTSGDMFYDLIDPSNIDILILISGCFGSDLSTDVVKRFLVKFSNIPAISIGIEIPGIPSIVTDNTTGMKNVIDHVITVHNCTRIAFIKGPENNDEANMRFDEYKKCLMNYSIPFDPGLVCEGNFEEEAGYNAVKTLLDDRNVSFDALAGVDDLSVHAAMDELLKRGYSIPEDIKIVGFDDIDKSQCSSPSLTTVRQPLFEIGSLAVLKALDVFQGKTVPECIVAPSKMIIRRSCGCGHHEIYDLVAVRRNKKRKPFKSIKHLFTRVEKDIQKEFNFTYSPLKNNRISELLYAFFVTVNQVRTNEKTDEALQDIIPAIVSALSKMDISISFLERFYTKIFHAITEISESYKQCQRLNEVWRNALITTYQHGAYIQSMQRIEVEKETDILRIAGDQLIRSFDYTGIKEILLSFLPFLGIHECYIAFYEKDVRFVRLMFGMKGGKEIKRTNTRYKAIELMPGGLVKKQNTSYYVLTLISEDREFGYIIFELVDTSSRKYDTLAGKIATALHGAELVGKIKEQNLALRESESEDLRTTLNSIGDAVVVVDETSHITRMNPVAEELTGWPFIDAVGLHVSKVFFTSEASHRLDLEKSIKKILRKGKPVGTANYIVIEAKNSSRRHLNFSGAPIRHDDGSISGAVLVFRDITEQRDMEEKLRHSQKLDSIGQLAGGIAHDFNNMLGCITGAAQIMALKPADTANVKRYSEMIYNVSMEAADLNRNLLLFSRKVRVQSLPVDIHSRITNTVTILSHTIDRRINLSNECNAGNYTVIGDPSQIQNALLNIFLNARDAMPDGGNLDIITSNVKLNKKFCDASEYKIKSGEFIEITIRDSGTGMSSKTLDKMFEPFFTTKEVGKGTGLGLAAVYGIVKDHDGAIAVSSEPGKGTIFKMYLPVIKSVISERDKNKISMPSGEGCILIIDDEPIIRETSGKILGDLGYTILYAQNGKEGLQMYKQKHRKIDLVLLDIVMPVMNGYDTFKALRKINPQVKIMITSGFSQDAGVNTLIQEGAVGFFEKPYRIDELSRRLFDLLSK